MTVTRMIFAIQTTAPKPTRVRVRGNVGAAARPITCRRRGDTTSTEVACVDGAWTLDLDPGDYLVELQVTSWVAGRLDIVAELAPGQQPPTFVYHGPLSSSPTAVGLAAWSATTAYIDPPESSLVDDPKDPWPPPPLARVALAVASADWFTAELAAARARIQSGDKGVPADVLDAMLSAP